MSTGTWIDPPSGWRYGFPKIKTCDTPLRQWLVVNGYPESKTEFAASNCRVWNKQETPND